ncbi:MAG: hypothetical protein KKB70_06675 [Proteobacteria bacterium]|nr:hypothetical protein [Pseudomonadota bacterium]MBU1611346.1 hypothetical protein [Pseudomonadota bacterium]
MNKTHRTNKILLFIISVLLAVALTTGLAFADCSGGGGGGGSSEGGSSGSTASKEAKSSFTGVKRAIDKVEESGGGEATTVDLIEPGAAVTATPGQVPSSEGGVSENDKARLDGISVNKGAPTPTKLQ